MPHPPDWTEPEKETLRKLYPVAPMDELIQIIGRIFGAVCTKANDLGIHRTYNNKCPLEVRFQKSFVPDPNTGCWLWIAAPGSGGYGQISYKNKSTRAHRVSWMIHRGEIPQGMDVLHKCDCRPCVNPDHLFLGTHVDNAHDRHQKKRDAYGEKHGMAKLTDEDVVAIRQDARSNIELAKLYGLHRTTPQAIRVRKIWKHL